MRLLNSLVLVCALPVASSAQRAPEGRNPMRLGETLVYEVKFGALTVGSGRMEVVGLDTVRGRLAYHTRLQLNAGVPGFRVSNILQSWIDAETLQSLRHVADQRQGSRVDKDSIEILPERGIFQETEWRQPKGASSPVMRRKPDSATVARPLDEVAFLYFARSLELEPGSSHSFHRYYKPDRNPVQLSVVRREVTETPAGSFPSIVVRPQFKTRGVFGQNGKAEVWFSDDESRIMVRLETSLPFGKIVLQLKEFELGAPREPKL